LFKLELVDSPECDRCNQASEMASHVLCDCEALAALRFRYLGHYFMKPGDFKDISVSRLLYSKCGAAKHMNIRAAQKIRNGQCAWDALVPALLLLLTTNDCTTHIFYFCIREYFLSPGCFPQSRHHY
jgi:hypothetical protein